jgi:hypothetical protein
MHTGHSTSQARGTKSGLDNSRVAATGCYLVAVIETYLETAAQNRPDDLGCSCRCAQPCSDEVVDDTRQQLNDGNHQSSKQNFDLRNLLVNRVTVRSNVV